jgi:predicted RNA binding protein YcfA (HicA-like mRNA interferase family)
MHSPRKDLSVAVRQFRRNPGFALAVVSTLALAIGANIAVFSVVNAVLFRALPFTAPERLVWVTSARPDNPAAPFSLPNSLTIGARHARSLASPLTPTGAQAWRETTLPKDCTRLPEPMPSTCWACYRRQDACCARATIALTLPRWRSWATAYGSGDSVCRQWQYTKVHQVGSHIILETSEPTHQRIAIPAHHPLRLGTFSSILRTVAKHKGVSRDELIATL